MATRTCQGLGPAHPPVPLGPGRCRHRPDRHRVSRRRCDGVALPPRLCGAGAAAVPPRLGFRRRALVALCAFIYAPDTCYATCAAGRTRDHLVGHNPLGALRCSRCWRPAGAGRVPAWSADDEIANAGPLTRFVSGARVVTATGSHKTWGQWLVIGAGRAAPGGHRWSTWWCGGQRLVRPMSRRQAPRRAAAAGERATTPPREWLALALAARVCRLWSPGCASLGAL